MDWNRFEGNWKQFSGRVKEKWGKLTDDDLDVINADASNWKERFRSATALPKTKSAEMWTTGLSQCREGIGRMGSPGVANEAERKCKCQLTHTGTSQVSAMA